MRAAHSISTGPRCVSITSAWPGRSGSRARRARARRRGRRDPARARGAAAVPRSRRPFRRRCTRRRLSRHTSDICVDALPADGVHEHLRAAQQLLHEQLGVRHADRVRRPELSGEGRADLVLVRAEDHAVGAGAVDRLDDDRPVVAGPRPRHRRLGARRLQLLHGPQAGAAQRLRHRVLVAARRAQGGPVGVLAELLAEGVGKRHAGLGTGHHEGDVVAAQVGERRFEVAVHDVGDIVVGAISASVERGRRRALDVHGGDARAREARGEPRARRVAVDDDGDTIASCWAAGHHAAPTSRSRSSGPFGRASKPP